MLKQSFATLRCNEIIHFPVIGLKYRPKVPPLTLLFVSVSERAILCPEQYLNHNHRLRSGAASNHVEDT
jgi:hypothetical protein